MLRVALVVAALAGLSSVGGAQITTYVSPPRPTMTPQMVAAADSARQDSVAAVATTNMKAWVDSAAGIAVPDRVGDTAAVDPGEPDVTTFSDGSVAPNTASLLPSMGALGITAVLVGAALLMRKSRG